MQVADSTTNRAPRLLDTNLNKEEPTLSVPGFLKLIPARESGLRSSRRSPRGVVESDPRVRRSPSAHARRIPDPVGPRAARPNVRGLERCRRGPWDLCPEGLRGGDGRGAGGCGQGRGNRCPDGRAGGSDSGVDWVAYRRRPDSARGVARVKEGLGVAGQLTCLPPLARRGRGGRRVSVSTGLGPSVLQSLGPAPPPHPRPSTPTERVSGVCPGAAPSPHPPVHP